MVSVLPGPNEDERGGDASPTVTWTPAVPRRLGHYEVIRLLGRGGMGAVFEARHTRLLRRVAIKVVAPERLHDSQAVIRFQREIVALGAVQHANIVQALDAGEELGVAYLVMEYVAGSNVAAIAHRHGRLAVADACEIVRQAAIGLHHAHLQRIVHRDVKPGNLLLGHDGIVKVADLGLARLLDSVAAGQEITESHVVLGSINYMAPEQATGSHHVDARADVYGLGAVLYRLLWGQSPYFGPEYETPHQVLLALATKAWPPPSEFNSHVPAELVTLVERCMAKRPDGRFASAQELAQALTPYAASAQLARLAVGGDEAATPGYAPQAREFAEVAATPAGRWHSSRRRRWTVAGVLVACAAVALWLLTLGDPTNESNEVTDANAGNHRGGASGVHADANASKKPVPRPSLSRLAWHDMTDLPLVLVHQPDAAGLATWTLDQKLRQIKLSTRDTTVLAFDATPEMPFRIHCDVVQNHWTGGWGVIWGARKALAATGTAWSFQEIDVQPASESGVIDGSFFVIRSLVKVHESPSRIDATPIGRSPVSLSGPLPQTLEIDVGRTGLLSVRLGGVSLPSLCTPEANARCAPEDHEGLVGIKSAASDVSFQAVRVMLY